MNFEELYKPYVTVEAPDVTGQIKWLLKEFPQHIIYQAMLSVYTEVEKGKALSASKDHTATWHLWMYLKDVAQEMHKQELTLYVKHLESFHTKLAEKIDAEWNALSGVKKIWEVLRGRA